MVQTRNATAERVEVDCPTCPEGFLRDTTDWSREVARALALKNDLGPLTDAHFKIIEFVREYYLRAGDGPPVVKIARATGMSAKQICTLFPCGVARGAYRLAGLPRPSGCF
jgi:tRNA 2-thiouridine synthesizing protein E